MAETARRYSTREVRRRIWQTLFRHFLPLMGALLILSLPLLAAGVLDGMAESCEAQADALAQEHFARSETPYEDMTSEERVTLFSLFRDSSHLRSQAGNYELIASILSLAGFILGAPLLFGVNLVLINILRGGEFHWRDAHITAAEFRKAFKLQCYIAMLMLFMALPGYLLCSLFDWIGTWEGVNDTVILILQLIAIALMAILPFYASLKYQLAPRLLADGAEGVASELVSQSTDILDRHALLPILSILFPGLLALLGTWALHMFVLPGLLSPILTEVLYVLLQLPGYAWLLTGSAAIYVTFRTE